MLPNTVTYYNTITYKATQIPKYKPFHPSHFPQPQRSLERPRASETS